MSNQQQHGTTRSSAWLGAEDSAMGFHIEVNDAACDTSMLQGSFRMLEGLSGIGLQCCQHREMHSCTVTTHLPPGAVFVYLTHGAIEFYLQDKRFFLQAETGVCVAFAVNLTQTTELRRMLRKGHYVEKLVLTLMPECLQKTLTHESFTALGESFFAQHMQNQVWHLTPADVSLCRSIVTCQAPAAGRYCALEQEAAVLTLVRNALQQLQPAVKLGPPTQVGERIAEHLNQWLAAQPSPELLDVNKIARRLNMSTSKLQRAFKQYSGISVMEYIRKQRLLQAKQAMKLDGISIGEAAFRAGYKHSSNFCLAFKKTFGYSPGSLRSQGRAL